MKLLWHLVRTDLKRFRLMIAVWTALVVAGVVLYAVSPGVAGDMRLSGTVLTAAGLVWLARQILTIAVVPLIVQAHPAVGSTAFWMTRPIPSRVLIASKTLLIFGVTVGIPVAGDLVLALGLHVPARETSLSALQVALANGIWVAALMTLAVLTRTLAQFALAAGITVAAAALVSMLAGLLAVLRVRRPGVLVPTAFDPWIPVITALVVVVFLAAMWAVQYIRRNRIESIPVGAAGLCVALVFASTARPPLVASRIEPPAWAGSARLQLRGDRANGGQESGTAVWPQGDIEVPAFLRGLLVIPELPPGWFARATLREASIAFTDTTLTWNGPRPVGRGVGRLFAPAETTVRLSRGAEPDSAAEDIAVREALGLDRRLNQPAFGPEHSVLFVAPKDEIDRLASRRGTYRGTFRLELKHVEAVATLPLARGATFQDAAYRVAITDVQLDGPPKIRLHQSNAAKTFSRPGNPSYEFYLCNRRRGEALRGYIVHDRPRFVIPPVSGIVDMANATPGVTTTANALRFSGWAETDSLLTAEWLKDAELVLVRTTNAGTIERQLQIDDFRWPGGSKE